MTEFTKERLAIIARSSVMEFVYGKFRAGVSDLAAFALVQLERAENAEAENAKLRACYDDLISAVKQPVPEVASEP